MKLKIVAKLSIIFILMAVSSSVILGCQSQKEKEQSSIKNHVGDVDKEIEALKNAQKPPGKMFYEKGARK